MKILSNFTVFPRRIRGILFLLFATAFLPMAAMETIIFYTWYENRWNEEIASNRKLAEAMGKNFDRFLQDIFRYELAIGNGLMTIPSEKKELAGRFLEENSRIFAEVKYFAWIAPEGRILLASRREIVGQNVHKQTYFQRAVSGNVSAVSDLLPDGFLGKPGFFLFRRIEDAKRRLQGIMMAEVDPEKLGILVSKVEGRDDGLFTIYDRQGRVVYDYPELNLAWNQREWKKEDSLLARALEGKEIQGLWISSRNRERNIAVRVPIRSVGWVAGASYPEKKAMKEIYWNMKCVLAGSLGVLGLSIIMALFVGWRVVTPIRSLQDYAAAVGEGNFRSRDKIAEVWELEKLAEAFDRMAYQLEVRKQKAQDDIDNLRRTQEILRERDTALQQAKEQLEIRVQERTAELERATAELEQFTYVASHDLQEPLRMVVSYVQLLEKEYQERLGPEADEFINFAVEGATRMQKLINDLLAVLRVKTRFSPFRHVNCEKNLERVLIHLKPSIDQTRAEITHDPLPVVMGDETQLTLVLWHLVDNAVKFHGSDPPKVHISAEAGEKEWIFLIRDNGIGIEREYYDRIFIIFQRLHTRRHYPGTGTGLALCKRIVERHGGRIWVVSKPGEGSTFFFSLPLLR